MFTFDFVEGSSGDGIVPDNVIIPLSLSRRLFGNEPAVGKQLFVQGWGFQTIMAVYRNFPTNSIIGNDMFFAKQPHENVQNWQNWNYTAFLRVDNATNTQLIIDNFKRNFDAQAVWGDGFDWETWGVGI